MKNPNNLRILNSPRSEKSIASGIIGGGCGQS